jgi:pSer/pThr/pTyr-binding forkhead associated (FHA) protein
VPNNPATEGPSLLVVEGRRSGDRLSVETGQYSVGRDSGSAIRLDDDGVSRNHAVVVRAANTVTVEDAGSTNGTWVNGSRITSARVLEPGDRVGIGAATLQFQGGSGTYSPSSGSAQRPATRRRGRIRVGRVVLIGGLANLVLLATGVLIHALTDWTGIGAWIAAPITGMVAALIEVARETLTREPEEAAAAPAPGVEGAAGPPATPAGAPAQTGPVRKPQRRATVAVGVIVAVLVVGAGGALLAYGVATTVSGFITGEQGGGVERLEAPLAQDSAGIVVTIESIEQTNDFTRVELTVQNNLSDTVSLPLFRNASLRSEDGTTLVAGASRHTWSESIPAGGLQRGTIVFTEHLPDGPTTAMFAIATVYGPGALERDGAVIVEGLAIAAMER